MSVQCRHALVRLRVPDLDSLDNASTCIVLAVWAPCDGPDPTVSDEMSQHTKQLTRKLDEKKKLTNLSASVAICMCSCIKELNRNLVHRCDLGAVRASTSDSHINDVSMYDCVLLLLPGLLCEICILSFTILPPSFWFLALSIFFCVFVFLW